MTEAQKSPTAKKARKTRADKGTKVPAISTTPRAKAETDLANTEKKVRGTKKPRTKKVTAPKKIKQGALTHLAFNLRQVFEVINPFVIDYDSLKLFITKEVSDSLNRTQAIDTINDKLREHGAFCVVIDQTETDQGILVVSNSRPFVSSEKTEIVYNPVTDQLTIPRPLLAPELISFKYGSAFDTSSKAQEW
jgi:hypothetical protein